MWSVVVIAKPILLERLILFVVALFSLFSLT
jgi:hypothetical protein